MPTYRVFGWHTAHVHSEFRVEAANKREAARMVREGANGVGLFEEIDSDNHGPEHIEGVEAVDDEKA